MVFDFSEAHPDVVPEKKASATGRVVLQLGSGGVSPRDLVSLAKTGFQGNPMGFRAVKLISKRLLGYALGVAG